MGLLLWFGLVKLRPAGGRASPTPTPLAMPIKPATSLRPAAQSEPAAGQLPMSPSAAASAIALADDSGLAPDDVRRATELMLRLNARRRAEEPDLPLAEELFARYPREEKLGDLLENVLLSLASQRREQRRFGEAQAQARRAISLRPRNLTGRALLVALLMETNDFAGAEAAAREALTVDPRNAELWLSLAFALFRQDRNREAIEATQSSLGIQESEPARALLAQLLKTKRDEQRMTEQQLSHFHVRYDGASHEDVGREILRQLERHYATLVRTFDHEPSTAIPVILFTSEQYYTASGAPAWAGGNFDGMDGRIRIPIGGISASLTPEMDGTLIHELTHAFIYDMSRGTAPREVHEGVAQYMEGKRAARMFTPQQLAMLADGRAGGVGGFYAEALVFVEYLIANHGTGGINDLLRAMGETGNVNAAFSRVHGLDYASTVRAWRQRLKQQYGS